MAIVRKAVLLSTCAGAHHYPSVTAMSTLLLPLVDRDGLTKPALQIAIEEAIDSGIDEVAVILPKAIAAECRAHFQPYPSSDPDPLHGQDWSRIHREKIVELGRRLTLIETTPERIVSGAALVDARQFVGNDRFLLFPISRVFLSGTKDRAAAQLLNTPVPPTAKTVLTLGPIMRRDLHQSIVVAGEATDPDRPIFSIDRIADGVLLEDADRWAVSSLPPGHFLADQQLSIVSPELITRVADLTAQADSVSGSVLTRAIADSISRPGTGFGVTLAVTAFDLSLPYGLLEAQFGLGLAGIHRAELCEMIARTLAEQAKR